MRNLYVYLPHKIRKMNSTKIRKEVTLDAQIIERLKILAMEEGRSLKNYMEKVLKDKTEPDFVVTENYKKMIDDFREKERNGEMKWISLDDFKRQIGR